MRLLIIQFKNGHNIHIYNNLIYSIIYTTKKYLFMADIYNIKI